MYAKHFLTFKWRSSFVKLLFMNLRQRISLIIFGLSAAFAPLHGQSNAAFASLNQDVQYLGERVKKLSLAVEVMERENQQLKRSLEAQMKAHKAMLSRFESLNASIDARLQGQSSRDAALKKEILGEVSVQIKKLASETQKALDSLSKAIGSEPQIEVPVEFDDNYPQEGVAYEVQPGDTLSGIAQKLNSTVRDIQNANRIADPSRLAAGKTIFVPQSNPE